MAKTFILLGSILSFLGVALGAFGAHGLKARLSADMLAVYQTGIQYHLIHALALLVLGVLMRTADSSQLLNWSGYLFIAGIFLFSGSLYILSISGIRALGAITPLGGLAFLIGWLFLAMAAWKLG